eukprot:c4374_g1_i1.p1 GENE.c4374_g1_i1~~c4374_g1_i1.p1  ORF type:complete len:521 (-),score=101.67 c4374_g1_i1:168-1730(-)
MVEGEQPDKAEPPTIPRDAIPSQRTNSAPSLPTDPQDIQRDLNFPLSTKVFKRANEPPLVVIVGQILDSPESSESDEDDEGIAISGEGGKRGAGMRLEIQSYSRKEKSLSVLCHHFLELFRVKGQEICLHSATSNLSTAVGMKVERRRIYDIVNVLESVQVLERMGKNRYAWLGLDNIPIGLERIQQEEAVLKSSQLGFERRENSLGSLSRAFVRLFLRGETEYISLEDAAVHLLGCIDPKDKQQSAPKVRRLYDIANVFTSIGLIKKVKLSNSRKPAFQWAGPIAPNNKRNHKTISPPSPPPPTTSAPPPLAHSTPNKRLCVAAALAPEDSRSSDVSVLSSISQLSQRLLQSNNMTSNPQLWPSNHLTSHTPTSPTSSSSPSQPSSLSSHTMALFATAGIALPTTPVTTSPVKTVSSSAVNSVPHSTPLPSPATNAPLRLQTQNLINRLAVVPNRLPFTLPTPSAPIASKFPSLATRATRPSVKPINGVAVVEGLEGAVSESIEHQPHSQSHPHLNEST